MRQLLAPIAVAAFAASMAPRIFDVGARIGDRAASRGIPPELPPPPFFAILWGVIFFIYGGFAVHAWRSDARLVRRVAPPLAAAGLGAAVWMLATQFVGDIYLDFVLLFAVLGPAWIAARRFDRDRGLGGSPLKWSVDVLTGLFAGWSSVAVAISIPILIRNIAGLGASDYEWRMLWVVVGALAGMAWIAARWVTRSPWYFAAVGWGVLGIAMNNFLRTGMGWLAWAALLSGGLIVAIRAARGARGARNTVIYGR